MRSRTKRPRRHREAFEALRNGRAAVGELSKPYETVAPTAGRFRSRTKQSRRRQDVFEALRNGRDSVFVGIRKVFGSILRISLPPNRAEGTAFSFKKAVTL
ncbi:hypothetical protein B5F77_03360 [Parabacteroides sp. An277]|nr:hypothetical protein B5F77_03360 [Parabacteroides sp. An277]